MPTKLRALIRWPAILVLSILFVVAFALAWPLNRLTGGALVVADRLNDTRKRLIAEAVRS